MYSGCVSFGRRGVAIKAMAGVDLARWELKGRDAGLSVAWRQTARPHPHAYAFILFGRDGSETAAIGQPWMEAGYTSSQVRLARMGTSEEVDLDMVPVRVPVAANTQRSSTPAVLGTHTRHCDELTSLSSSLQMAEGTSLSGDLDGYFWLRDRFPYRSPPPKVSAAGAPTSRGIKRQAWTPIKSTWREMVLRMARSFAGRWRTNRQ